MELKVIPGKELESDITLVGQGSHLKGDLQFDRFTRIHGRIDGTVSGTPGSLIVVGETATIHADFNCHDLVIDGFVRGNVVSKGKVTIARTGRLVGHVKAPQFEVQFGAHFEGKATTTRSRDTSAPSGESLATDSNMA